jgi:tetratricopeptide (TPR) repeat protein
MAPVSDPASRTTITGDDPGTGSTPATLPEPGPGLPRLPDPMDDPAQRERQAAMRARLFGARPGARTSPFGRYRLLERLGAGATGVVHVAYDPMLDRRIALKILRDPGGRERSRLLREARAIASVRHPNVVEVFEVGEAAGRDGAAGEAFIALELVEGTTLRRWARSRAWGWPELVAAYAQAGRGLAAAHAHGLVHRDFKPDNAMMGKDGRVRVLDFGLARGSGHGQVRTEGASQGPLDATLTRSGALAGTPAYMAPELLEGHPADARSDQFALAVAVYEALYGERPFDGDTIPELVERVLANARRPRPRDVTLPRALQAVVERALQRDPAARWPSMDAFVDALEGVARRARRRRRGAWALALVGASALALALALWPRDDEPRPREADVACRPGPERLRGLWDAPRRAALVDRWRGPDGSPSPQGDSIVGALDERAAAWARAWTEACEGMRTAQDLALDVRARCLEQHRDELGEVVQALEAMPATALPRARALVDALPRDACTPESGFPLPPEPERARAVEDTLAALRRAGHRCVLEGPWACEDALEAGLVRARELEHPPLLAYALQQAGALADQRGEAGVAEARYGEAFFLARSAGRHGLAAKTAINLVDLVGYRGERHDEGEQWARQAEAMLASVATTSRMHGDLLNNRGLLRMGAGRTSEAERDYRAALEAYARVPELDPTATATVLGNLAQVSYMALDMDAAIELLDQALATYDAQLGPDHLESMSALGNRGLVKLTRGDVSGSEADLRRVIAIGERHLGPEHPELETPYRNLGRTLERKGDHEGARAALQRAEALQERRQARELELSLSRSLGSARSDAPRILGEP